MSKLDQFVFVIANGKIVESKIRDLNGYIDETTTPLGIGPRYHTRDYPKFSIDGQDFERREDAEEYDTDNEMPPSQIVGGVSYELWTWGHQGNNPRQITTFDTEAEAQDALEETFYMDFINCTEILSFATRADAEKFLADSEY